MTKISGCILSKKNGKRRISDNEFISKWLAFVWWMPAMIFKKSISYIWYRLMSYDKSVYGQKYSPKKN